MIEFKKSSSCGLRFSTPTLPIVHPSESGGGGKGEGPHGPGVSSFIRVHLCLSVAPQVFRRRKSKAPAARDRRRYGYNDICTQESRSPFSWRIVRHGSTDGAGRLADGSEPRHETVVVTTHARAALAGRNRPRCDGSTSSPQRLVLNALVNVLKLDPVDLQERAPDGVQTDVSIRLALRTRLGVDHRFVWSALRQTFSMVPAWLAVGQPILAAAALWGRMASCRRLIIGASQAANKLPKAGYQPAADYQALRFFCRRDDFFVERTLSLPRPDSSRRLSRATCRDSSPRTRSRPPRLWLLLRCSVGQVAPHAAARLPIGASRRANTLPESG